MLTSARSVVAGSVLCILVGCGSGVEDPDVMDDGRATSTLESDLASGHPEASEESMTDEAVYEDELGSASDGTRTPTRGDAPAGGVGASEWSSGELGTMAFGLAGSCGGSWTESCSGQSLGTTIRNATCFTRAGASLFTESFDCGRCGDGVANCDGRLICEGDSC